jgi:hypothetical protein
MGLLGDYLPDWLPDDPAKKEAMRAGLLNFGAALMGGQGNVGQILGNGLMAGTQGYGGALDAQQKQALQAEQMRHYGMENKKLQNEIDEPMNLQKIISGGSAGAPSQDGARPLSALPRVGQPSGSPAAPVATPMPAQAPASLFQNYIDIGDRLTNAGKPANAKQYYDLAEKLRPKVKDLRAMSTPDGKRVMVQTFEDGSKPQMLDGYAPDLEKVAFQNTGGATLALDPFTGKPVNTIANTQSPDSIASTATTRRWQDLTHADNTAGDQAPITDAAILNAAARYNLDGTLPPMGMGKNAAAGRSAILNQAAVLKDGVDPEQQRRDQLTFKADNASQTAAVKAFTSGKQGNSVRSFNVSLSHLDTLSSLADALHNGDAKMFNKFGNYIAEQTGNPAPTNFDAAKKIVGDEVVKAIVGAGGGVHDREEAARVIASANSPAQLKGAIGTYQELMRGQLDGLQQQYEASTGRKDFNKFLSQHAQDTRGPASNSPQKGAHPPEINSLLSKYGVHQ